MRAGGERNGRAWSLDVVGGKDSDTLRVASLLSVVLRCVVVGVLLVPVCSSPAMKFCVGNCPYKTIIILSSTKT